MSLITPADAQALGIGLDLSDAALQAVIDREETEIVRRFGANYTDASTTIAESVMIKGPSVYLRRAILSVSSVSEVTLVGGYTRVLVATDYYAWIGTPRVQRLLMGGWFGDRVDVVYVPQDDTNLRKSVLLELIRIGSDQQTSGVVAGLGFKLDATKATANQFAERETQLTRLVLVPAI